MFGPYDKKFDKNKNGIMEDDEKLEEQENMLYTAEMGFVRLMTLLS